MSPLIEPRQAHDCFKKQKINKTDAGFQEKVIKEHAAPALIAGTFSLGLLNYHVRSPTTLRAPCQKG